MRYIVHAVTQSVVSIEIEADSPEEAMAEATQHEVRDWDVWDSDIHLTDVTATF